MQECHGCHPAQSESRVCKLSIASSTLLHQVPPRAPDRHRIVYNRPLCVFPETTERTITCVYCAVEYRIRSIIARGFNRQKPQLNGVVQLGGSGKCLKRVANREAVT